ncbi:MAG TPA: hypothetical protein VMV52_09715 [Candidatus Nanopelagicaceae bacterium]|nr:hypothetical protein [Candidatus Nanopelagicaceae bacterium]
MKFQKFSNPAQASMTITAARLFASVTGCATRVSSVVVAVRELMFANLGRGVEIKVQRGGDEAWTVGAATLVLRESFSILNTEAKSRA